MNKFWSIFTSLKLTIILLVAAMAVIFFGTLDQVDFGIYEVQKRYFGSFFTTWSYPLQWPGGKYLNWLTIPLPGGYLLAGLLLINLVAAHFKYFVPKWNKIGIIMIHFGILLLIVSGVVTSLFQEESQMLLSKDQPSNFSQVIRENELVIIDTSNPSEALTHTISEKALRAGYPINIANTPLSVQLEKFYPNSDIGLRSQNPEIKEKNLATQGAGVKMDIVVFPKPITHKPDEVNGATAYVTIKGEKEDEIGTWLVSTIIDERFPAQKFTYQEKTYEVALRPKRIPLPFALKLLKFNHDLYPGTDIPRNFSSLVEIIDPLKEDNRTVLIYMNNPLRYGGYTFYQSSYNGQNSILQVVKNPGWLLPYFCVLLIGLGLLLHFVLHLVKYLHLKKSSPPTLLPEKSQTPNFKISNIKPLPLVIFSISAIIILVPLIKSLRPNFSNGFDIALFQKLPVQESGRIKPIDTIARNYLLMFSGKQSIPLPDQPKKRICAINWLMDLTMRPEVANTYKVFRIDNAEVLGLFSWEKTNEKHFSFNELASHLDEIVKQSNQIKKEKEQQTVFEQQLNNLYQSLLAYNRLIALFSTVTKPEMVEQEYATWTASITPGMLAIQAQEKKEPYDAETLARFISFADRYLDFAKLDTIGIVPPITEKDKAQDKWANVGQALLDVIVTQQFPEILINYAQLTLAYRQMDSTAFNNALAKLHSELDPFINKSKINFEVFFNNFEPFYLCSILYILVFIIICFNWMLPNANLRNTAFYILFITFLIHTFGLVARMYIQGRPPVTNLYSSAIFIGWASVLLGLLMEKIHKNGLGAAVASIIGFSTLIIAHNLGMGSDTLEMVRAVLDSNFWLSTHVVVVTLGYSAMFLMGILAIFYIIGNLITTLSPQIKKSLSMMVFGILCFATLFSFVGTMLGGIWADQSWGRFWGWDPKENGALLIVLWCAIMLHARWGRLVQHHGLMIMAVIGNIITSWSWFGTNMLGVGLHSYGFMDRAFWILTTFILTQLIIVIIGLLSNKTKPNSFNT